MEAVEGAMTTAHLNRWHPVLRQFYLVVWIILAFNGAFIAGRLSREPLHFVYAVVRFLAAHVGHVSLADLQRNSGGAGNDFAVYRRLYGEPAVRQAHEYIVNHPLRGCVPDPTEPRLQEIQDAQAAANDRRFKDAFPALVMLWGAWGLVCALLPGLGLRLHEHPLATSRTGAG